MKRLLLFLVLSACATAPDRRIASAPDATKIPGTPAILTKPFQGPFLVNPEGATRPPAKVYLPLQFASQEQWPLVVLLHGFSGTADTEDQYLTMRFRVSNRGFILLTPDGTLTPKGTLGTDGKDLGGNPFWNATDFCCDFAKTGVDDAGYLRKLIEIVKAKYNVDPARVYIFGHSNGGFMANRLACEMGDQIAGIASLAGGTYANAELCRDPKPVPYLQIHAPDDPTISYDAGQPLYAGGKATIAQWLAKNGCPAEGRHTLNKDFVMIIPGNDTSMEAWNDCSSGRPVALWTIKPYEGKYHNAHIPIFNLDFSDAVLTFLLDQKL
jgi:polyhydroxybutyrate depolymerase